MGLLKKMSELTPEMLSNVFECQLMNLIDGDTMDLKVNLGFNIFINIRCRLKDVDTPEIHNTKHTSEEWSKGFRAKQLVAQYLYGEENSLYVQAEHKGIHGRWLGEIWRNVGEDSLNDFLIENYYSNNEWSWYAQEPLIENWFERNPVVAPGGQHLEAWYNWGKDVFFGYVGKVMGRFK